jgi:cephalosporin-C deacetylase-like acetyl esterase
VQAVNEGYIVIAATTRGFGDTRTKFDAENNRVSSCRIELMHGLLVGRTAIGERVWDISRLIDWATSRDDVDAKRIAITGNSGGGTISVFAPACDTRISVAVPSCYFCRKPKASVNSLLKGASVVSIIVIAIMFRALCVWGKCTMSRG